MWLLRFCLVKSWSCLLLLGLLFDLLVVRLELDLLNRLKRPRVKDLGFVVFEKDHHKGALLRLDQRHVVDEVFHSLHLNVFLRKQADASMLSLEPLNTIPKQ